MDCIVRLEQHTDTAQKENSESLRFEFAHIFSEFCFVR